MAIGGQIEARVNLASLIDGRGVSRWLFRLLQVSCDPSPHFLLILEFPMSTDRERKSPSNRRFCDLESAIKMMAPRTF